LGKSFGSDRFAATASRFSRRHKDHAQFNRERRLACQAEAQITIQLSKGWCARQVSNLRPPV
jgi:hypothetical protein